MTGHPLRRTKGNEEKGIRPKPVLPSAKDMAILRRAAQGYIFATQTEDGPEFRYDDGAMVSLRDGAKGGRQFARMIAEGWLIPDKHDSLLDNGPPQLYRARKPGI